jgi:hypothetical protein
MARSILAALLLFIASTTLAQKADLQMTATADRPRVETGGLVNVTLTARNIGPDPSVRPSVGVIFGISIVLSLVAPPDWTCSLLPSFSCSTTSFAAGSEATFKVTLLVPPDYPSVGGTAYINPGGTPDPTFQDSRAGLPFAIDRAAATADLSMELRARRNPVQPGTPAVMDALIENKGPDAAPGAYVSLSAPSGSTFAGNGWDCAQRSNGSLCHGGSIAPGQTSTITITTAPTVDEALLQFNANVAGERIADTNRSNNGGSATASAGAAENYELMLVPLTVPRTAGAFGAIWMTELHVFADELVDVFPRHVSCAIPEGCLPSTLPVGQPYDPVGDLVPSNGPGSARPSLIYTRRGDAGKLHFTLRVRDVSRPDESWGAGIPIVRERDFLTSRIVISDVPIDTAYRATLRVYDPDRRQQAPVIIRHLDENGHTIGENRRPFDSLATFTVTPALLPLRPAYLEVDLGAEGAQLLGRSARISVQVEGSVPGQRLWAFVSVTNNQTQQITVLTGD